MAPLERWRTPRGSSTRPALAAPVRVRLLSHWSPLPAQLSPLGIFRRRKTCTPPSCCDVPPTSPSSLLHETPRHPPPEDDLHLRPASVCDVLAVLGHASSSDLRPCPRRVSCRGAAPPV